jgi:hypothetical protein
MHLINELKKAQESKDYKRVNELRLALEEEANIMGTITVPGIAGTRLYHFQGGIGLPPSAIKVKNKWLMLDSNDPRIRNIILTSPTQNQRGLLSLIGRLYHKKATLPLITIDDLKELIIRGCD